MNHRNSRFAALNFALQIDWLQLVRLSNFWMLSVQYEAIFLLCGVTLHTA